MKDEWLIEDDKRKYERRYKRKNAKSRKQVEGKAGSNPWVKRVVRAGIRSANLGKSKRKIKKERRSNIYSKEGWLILNPDKYVFGK